MGWKQQLKNFEELKEWDLAIEFMQKVIDESSNDLDAYLSINYLLMNLLAEENYDFNKHKYYAELLNKYFIESYAKFSNNPEYLFYEGKMACIIAEWLLNISIEQADAMIRKATELQPKNILYKYGYYSSLNGSYNQLEAYKCAKTILEENSLIKKQIQSKGSLGEYILELMTNWSKTIEDELSGAKAKFFLKD